MYYEQGKLCQLQAFTPDLGEGLPSLCVLRHYTSPTYVGLTAVKPDN